MNSYDFLKLDDSFLNTLYNLYDKYFNDGFVKESVVKA